MPLIAELLREAVAGQPAEARFDAETLLGHVLGRDRAWLFAHASDPVEPAAAERFAGLWGRRGVSRF